MNLTTEDVINAAVGVAFGIAESQTDMQVHILAGARLGFVLAGIKPSLVEVAIALEFKGQTVEEITAIYTDDPATEKAEEMLRLLIPYIKPENMQEFKGRAREAWPKVLEEMKEKRLMYNKKNATRLN